MKTIILLLILLWIDSSYCYPQGNGGEHGSDINTLIEQIKKPGSLSIPSFQALNKADGNYVLTLQSGDQNNAEIRQASNDGFGRSNQVISTQAGNSNEFSAEQIGSGNLVRSDQSTYVSNLQTLEILAQRCAPKTGSWTIPYFGNNNLNVLQKGDDNCQSSLQMGDYNGIQALQQGNSNGILTIQQGSNNNIAVEQLGNYNLLSVRQLGRNNAVTGYLQENNSGAISADKINQIGENLTLISHDASRYKACGNSFSQTGANLTLEVNNGFLNSLKGVDIVQTGIAMKVIVDQSYFSTH